MLAGCRQSAQISTPLQLPSATESIATAPDLPSPTVLILPSDTPVPTELPTETPTQEPWVTVFIPSVTDELSGPSDGSGEDSLIPTPTPTITRRPTPSPPPPSARLTIQKPGPYSKVVSPIPLRAVINPGDDKQVYVDLIGEDGRVITSQRLDYTRSTDYYIYTTAVIPFEISSLAETARLVLYTLDRFNRTIYTASVDLILLQIGENQINVPEVEKEPYVIRNPWEGGTVRGGMMTVDGMARLVNDQPLIIEIIDEQGNLLGSGEADIPQPNTLQLHVPFTVFVPYNISRWTPARLVARQESATRIPGTVWLTSVMIYLEP
jgi:hypothetical protein